MVYWILEDDSDTRFEDKDDIMEFLRDDITWQADDNFDDWLNSNYNVYDLWCKWRDSRGSDSAYDLFTECEDEVWNCAYEMIEDDVDATFDILGQFFICMEDDEDDELMPKEEEE